MAATLVFAALAGVTSAAAPGKTIALPNAPGVVMPTINLGTCCGSDPAVGLQPWLDAGGVGIDTAWDYHDETTIGAILKKPGAPKRETLFITTKVPAGFGNATDCADPDKLPEIAYNYMVDNLRQLGVKYVDLALVHRPCGPSRFPPKDPVASNNALWKGMQMVKKAGLARAIGVSNYKADDLKQLDMSEEVPAINQCEMSLKSHDDETISYCQSKGIVYESYGTLRGCLWTDPDVLAIAKEHNVDPSQVCLRWVLERGAIMAAGTGSNVTTVPVYTKENLDIYSFSLTAEEVAKLNGKQQALAEQ